jgi:hypothetical protein
MENQKKKKYIPRMILRTPDILQGTATCLWKPQKTRKKGGKKVMSKPRFTMLRFSQSLAHQNTPVRSEN